MRRFVGSSCVNILFQVETLAFLFSSLGQLETGLYFLNARAEHGSGFTAFFVLAPLTKSSATRQGLFEKVHLLNVFEYSAFYSA